MVWFYIILAGIMCTILVNPMFWVRSISHLIYKIKSKAFINANPDKTKSDFDLPTEIVCLAQKDVCGYETLLGGIIAETVWFILGAFVAWIYFFLCVQDVGFVSLLSVMWIIPLFKIVVTLFLGCDYYFKAQVSKFITICVIFVISLAINIATPIYEFNNPKELTVSIIEPEVPKLFVDVAKTLESFQYTDETSEDGNLTKPVYRNGEVIYVLKSSNLYTESPGYISVKGDEVKFVEYELKYNPYTFGINNVTYVARQALPDKIFFGSSFSLQKDEDGTIYYASLYGNHSFLRAGKNIEGLVYVNAATGDVTTCTLEEIPDFMTGIAQ